MIKKYINTTINMTLYLENDMTLHLEGLQPGVSVESREQCVPELEGELYTRRHVWVWLIACVMD